MILQNSVQFIRKSAGATRGLFLLKLLSYLNQSWTASKASRKFYQTMGMLICTCTPDENGSNF